MAMMLCSSWLAAVDVTYDCVKSSVGTVGSPYRSSWGFPPVSASFRHRFGRLHPIDFAGVSGLAPFPPFPPVFFGMPTPNGAFGARRGCGKAPTVGLLQRQSGLGGGVPAGQGFGAR